MFPILFFSENTKARENLPSRTYTVSITKNHKSFLFASFARLCAHLVNAVLQILIKTTRLLRQFRIDDFSFKKSYYVSSVRFRNVGKRRSMT